MVGLREEKRKNSCRQLMCFMLLLCCWVEWGERWGRGSHWQGIKTAKEKGIRCGFCNFDLMMNGQVELTWTLPEQNDGVGM